jgi:hypothetical protein
VEPGELKAHLANIDAETRHEIIKRLLTSAIVATEADGRHKNAVFTFRWWYGVESSEVVGFNSRGKVGRA